MRLAASRAVAIETSRGWRITKEKASHKIDVIVALAQAALGAVKDGSAECAHVMPISFHADEPLGGCSLLIPFPRCRRRLVIRILNPSTVITVT